MGGLIKDFRGRVKFNESLRDLISSGVKVGIKDGVRQGGDLSNAELLYILENGSPQHNMPPRPVVEPGIEKVKREISEELGLAAKSVITNDKGVIQHLSRAGDIAVNSIQKIFGSSELAPNSPATKKNKGTDKPLIDTGTLMSSITYEVVIHNKSLASRDSMPELKTNSLGELTESVTTGIETIAESFSSVVEEASSAVEVIGAELL